MTFQRIGFTGTRAGMSFAQLRTVKRLLSEIGTSETHSGDCIGADADFMECVDQMNGVYSVGHPPNKRALRAFCHYQFTQPPRGYLERNRDIVDAAQLLIACPDSHREIPRSGTWYTVRYARSKNKPIIIVFPDGSELHENFPQPKENE